MKLILTRHGETVENIDGIIQGHLPGKLSEKGIDQAEQLARRLKSEKLDFIYSSDLERAAATARAIARFHPDIQIEFVEDLRERYLGTWQGQRREDLGFSADKGILEYSPQDGETLDEMYTRAGTFLNKLISKHPNELVLCVGHYGIYKAMLAVISGNTPAEILSIEDIHNTAVTIFEFDEKKHGQMELFNCTSHLKE